MKYYLVENKMTENPDDFTARVTQQETVGYKEIIKMATRRGLTLTDTELNSAITELMYTINEVLGNGKVVVTPFARFSPSISGVFNGKDDVYDSGRHKIKINCSVGKDIKADKENIMREKVKYTIAQPIIDGFLNFATQENNVLSPGGTAEISGELLKLDAMDTEQGIFFSQNGTTARADVIIHNLPSKLIFNIPVALTPGDYQLEIRNRTNGSSKLKNVIFSELLQVL